MQIFSKKSVEHNTKWRDVLTQTISGLGFEVLPSQANFLLVKFGDAPAAFNFLAQKGILVREVANYGLPEFLRISFGTDDENEYLMKCLAEYKA